MDIAPFDLNTFDWSKPIDILSWALSCMHSYGSRGSRQHGYSSSRFKYVQPMEKLVRGFSKAPGARRMPKSGSCVGRTINRDTPTMPYAYYESNKSYTSLLLSRVIERTGDRALSIRPGKVTDSVPLLLRARGSSTFFNVPSDNDRNRYPGARSEWGLRQVASFFDGKPMVKATYRATDRLQGRSNFSTTWPARLDRSRANTGGLLRVSVEILNFPQNWDFVCIRKIAVKTWWKSPLISKLRQ